MIRSLVKKNHLIQFLVWWCNCIVEWSYIKISNRCVIVICVSIMCWKKLYVKFDISSVGFMQKIDGLGVGVKFGCLKVGWGLWFLGPQLPRRKQDPSWWGSIPSRESGNWLVWFSNGLIFVRPWFLHGKLFHCHR